MCGICGVAGAAAAPTPVDGPTLRRMTDVITHRGPDDEGHHLAPGIALGMRRLSVIDPACSPQPIVNEDESVVTVFNGEIYNFKALRSELRAKGHRFTTEGDTETLVHLYEEHGSDLADRLRGMFAFAVWDARHRRLLLGRDRMGVKPLYIAQGPWGLAFASEVKSLLASGLIEPSLDPVAAELFMAHGYVPGPATLFAGVRKVMPASVLLWENGAYAGEREYWDPWSAGSNDRPRSWREDEKQLLELLREAVVARMVSDVPLGVMLSGGLDSSLITALMAEYSASPVKTFSIAFAEDAASNELDDARRVALRYGTDHHELTTSAVDHPDLLDESLWHMEEPVADLSGLGMLLLSKLARKSVTVALSGQGADELLGGYRKHQIAAAAGMVGRAPAPLGAALSRAAGRLPASSTMARGLRALGSPDPVERLLAMSRVVQAGERAETFTDAFRLATAEAEITASVRQHLPPRALTALGEILHLDTRLALVDNMLLYFDKMSMATSLEVRVPFMDHDVVAFCASLPDSRRVWLGRRKELLKRVSRGLVDDSIINKKKRGFFHAGLGTWLRVHRESLFRDVLRDERTRGRGMYRLDTVDALLENAGEDGKKVNQRLFCILLLEKWLRLFVDADSPGRALARQGQHRTPLEASAPSAGGTL